MRIEKNQTGKHSERGVALLFALVILVLLSIIALAFVKDAFFDQKAGHNIANMTSSRLLAEAAVHRIAVLLEQYGDQVAYSQGFFPGESSKNSENSDMLDKLTTLEGDTLLFEWNNAYKDEVNWEYLDVDTNGGPRLIGRFAYVALPFYPINANYLSKAGIDEGSYGESRIGAEIDEINVRSLAPADIGATLAGRFNLASGTPAGNNPGNWTDYAVMFGDLGLNGYPALQAKFRQWLHPGAEKSREAFGIDLDNNGRFNNDEWYHRFNLSRTDWDTIGATVENMYEFLLLDSNGDGYPDIDLNSADYKWNRNESDGFGIPWLAYFGYDKNGEIDISLGGSFGNSLAGVVARRRQIAANLVDYCDGDGIPTSDVPPSQWFNAATGVWGFSPTFTGNERTPYINEIAVELQYSVVYNSGSMASRDDGWLDVWTGGLVAQGPPGGTPPGHGGTPPGHGGTPPGHGGTPPGHGGTPPGHGGTPPGHGGTPPGHGGTPPGHGGGEDPPPGGGEVEYSGTIDLSANLFGEIINIYPQLTRPYQDARLTIAGRISYVIDIDGSETVVTDKNLSAGFDINDEHWNAANEPQYGANSMFVSLEEDVSFGPFSSVPSISIKNVAVYIDRVNLAYNGQNVDYAMPGNTSGSPFDMSDEGLYCVSFQAKDPRQNLNPLDWEVFGDMNMRERNTNSNPSVITGFDAEIVDNPAVVGTAGMSTAYIRNAPMISPWELGAIHRGAAWQTINLKEYDPNKAGVFHDVASLPYDYQRVPGGGSYADTVGGGGDANILDQIKMTSASLVDKKININARHRASAPFDPAVPDRDAVLQALFDRVRIGTTFGSPGTAGTQINVENSPDSLDDLIDELRAVPSFPTRAAVVNTLSGSDRVFSDGVCGIAQPTDAAQEELIGKTINLMEASGRAEYFDVVILVQTIRDVGDNATIVKSDIDGNPVTIDSCAYNQFDYRIRDGRYYYGDEITSEQKIRLLVFRSRTGRCEILRYEYVY